MSAIETLRRIRMLALEEEIRLRQEAKAEREEGNPYRDLPLLEVAKIFERLGLFTDNELNHFEKLADPARIRFLRKEYEEGEKKYRDAEVIEKRLATEFLRSDALTEAEILEREAR